MAIITEPFDKTSYKDEDLIEFLSTENGEIFLEDSFDLIMKWRKEKRPLKELSMTHLEFMYDSARTLDQITSPNGFSEEYYRRISFRDGDYSIVLSHTNRGNRLVALEKREEASSFIFNLPYIMMLYLVALHYKIDEIETVGTAMTRYSLIMGLEPVSWRPLLDSPFGECRKRVRKYKSFPGFLPAVTFEGRGITYEKARDSLYQNLQKYLDTRSILETLEHVERR